MPLIFNPQSFSKSSVNDRTLDSYHSFDLTTKLFNTLTTNDVSFLYTNVPVFLSFNGNDLKTETCFTQKFESFNNAIDEITSVSKQGYVPVIKKCEGCKVFRFLTQEEEILDDVYVKGALIDKKMTDIMYKSNHEKFARPIDFVIFMKNNGCSLDINDHVKIEELYRFITEFDFNYYDPKNVFVEKWKIYTKHVDSK